MKKLLSIIDNLSPGLDALPAQQKENINGFAAFAVENLRKIQDLSPENYNTLEEAIAAINSIYLETEKSNGIIKNKLDNITNFIHLSRKALIPKLVTSINDIAEQQEENINGFAALAVRNLREVQGLSPENYNILEEAIKSINIMNSETEGFKGIIKNKLDNIKDKFMPLTKSHSIFDSTINLVKSFFDSAVNRIKASIKNKKELIIDNKNNVDIWDDEVEEIDIDIHYDVVEEIDILGNEQNDTGEC